MDVSFNSERVGGGALKLLIVSGFKFEISEIAGKVRYVTTRVDKIG
jgi:hypothetical protein